MTLKDVADRAGVGIMTVSRVVNQPEAVSAELRGRVEHAIAAMGYVPNRSAGSLASNRSRLIAVIVPSLSSRVFGEIIVGADSVLGPEGLQIMVSNTSYSLEDEEAVCRRVLGWRPEGVIICGIDHSRGTREILLQSGLPVVEALELGERAIDINIGLSHLEAGRAAGAYLVERGHRRIAFAGAQMDRDFRAQRRRAGFLAALSDVGLEPAADLDLPSPLGFATGAEVFARLREAAPRADAVFCVNDELAVGAVGAAVRAGLKVPDDLAVMGFNDLDISAQIVPALTTIRSPREEMGRLAAEALLAARIGKRPRTRIDVGFRLVRRETA